MELQFTRDHDLSKLHDELLAALPSLRPAAERPVMRVLGREQTILIEVPDSTPGNVRNTIANLVAAHDPTPRVDPKSKAALRAEFAAASTQAAKLAVIAKLLDD